MEVFWIREKLNFYASVDVAIAMVDRIERDVIDDESSDDVVIVFVAGLAGMRADFCLLAGWTRC